MEIYYVISYFVMGILTYSILGNGSPVLHPVMTILCSIFWPLTWVFVLTYVFINWKDL